MNAAEVASADALMKLRREQVIGGG